MKKQIGIGYESFETLRQRNVYYIDKTRYICELLKRQSIVYLITRPRRFGKTLMLNTIEEFLDIRKNSKEIFEGLSISEDQNFCINNMNQYPVLSVSFKGIKANSFDEAFAMLSDMITEICKAHSYLLSSDHVDEDDRRIFRELKSGRASSVDVKKSLLTITRMMKSHYDKKVILLIDEYDVPLAGSEEYGYYNEMIVAIRSVFESVLKTNPHLDFAVVTGCLRISKESLFTGVNNLDVYSITTSMFSEMIGFTGKEVETLLKYFNLESHITKIKEWYDGYHFADADIYCPWDVINYCRDLLTDSDVRPKLYWKNTSGNSALEKFLHMADDSIRSDYQDLLADKSIKKRISEQLTYHSLTQDINNIWSLLLLTGYLTTVRMTPEERDRAGMNDNEQFLIIPNREMKELVEEIVTEWFSGTNNFEQKQKLSKLLLEGNPSDAENVLSELLFQTISYFDYNENFYHAFTAGILASSGYKIKSNREQGEGRSDIFLYNDRTHRAVILELKYSKKLSEMVKMCDQALKQIRDKRYGKGLEEEYDEILFYGISFFKKRCKIKMERHKQLTAGT